MHVKQLWFITIETGTYISRVGLMEDGFYKDWLLSWLKEVPTNCTCSALI